MLLYIASGIFVPPLSPVLTPDEPQFETIHHSLRGSPTGVHHTVKQLHHLRYADPNDWSKPQPTGQAGEVIVVLTRRLRLPL
ncbi:MAG: hypothetical protein F6J97_03845 [Leptolyngbya sp. SIO4C1]|nr:hypothetical protein [Leptolyngbya sp. SIO4C1]